MSNTAQATGRMPPFDIGSGRIPCSAMKKVFLTPIDLTASINAAYQLEEDRFWQGFYRSDVLSSRPPSPLSPLSDLTTSDDDTGVSEDEAQAACLWPAGTPYSSNAHALAHHDIVKDPEVDAMPGFSIVSSTTSINGTFTPVDATPDFSVVSSTTSMNDAFTPTITPLTSTQTVIVDRKREGTRARRRKKRVPDAMARNGPRAPSTKQNPLEAYPFSPAFRVKFDFTGLSSSSTLGAWTGLRYQPSRQSPPSLQDLLDDGFKLIKWDGRTTMAITDSASRIVAVLVGWPQDPTWPAVITDAAGRMSVVQREGEAQGDISDKYRTSRRGAFVSLPVGVSYGGGQKAPGNLVHNKSERRLLKSLLESHSIHRIAGFQSGAFATYAPKLYRFYAETLDRLFQRHLGLVRNFLNSVFPAISFNCGPIAVSSEHVDSGYLSYGLCAVTALGSYNHVHGGHIALYTFKLVAEFPPGSTILLPSGCTAHGNTSIQADETRLSITQYASGGLLRWVAYGFHAAKRLIATSAGRKRKLSIDGAIGEGWQLGTTMFSKLDELHHDLISVFGRHRKNEVYEAQKPLL